jgi:hypothetical protein
MYRMQKAETSGRDHGLTTAGAIVADEINLLTNIGTKLNQLLIIGNLEQIQAFLLYLRGRNNQCFISFMN